MPIEIQESLDQYLLPLRPNTSEGNPRKVGVEIEFSGLTTHAAADTIKRVVGGEINAKSDHLVYLTGSEIGRIKIELDAHFVHPKSSSESEFLKSNRELIGNVIRPVVPQELVTEPVEVQKLQIVEKIAEALSNAGGKGTNENLFYAFGLHLNPEIPSSDVEYLLAVIRSIILLEKIVYERINPDAARQIMGWAQPYSLQYKQIVMNPEYQPNIAVLIRDYISENNGRNHHLDMLPIFRYIDDTLVSELLGEKDGGARPAFHFRLPDSRIGDDGWSIKENWNLWVAIENMAERLGEKELESWQAANPL